MPVTVTPFLMFEGQAREAMAFYLSLFPDAAILEQVLYGPGEPGPEGTVKAARFTLAGQTVMCSDSFVQHGFTFTPSLSFFVDCESTERQDALVAALSDGGKTYMPLGDYGFSRRFAWIGDRFGITWQLNLP